MSKLLDEIVEIEKEAEQILKTAEEKSNNIKQEVEVKKENVKNSIKEKTKETLKNFVEKEEKNFVEKVINLENEKNSKINLLEQIFKNNGNEWVEEIVFNVIKQ